jgi:hypothetical protein
LQEAVISLCEFDPSDIVTESSPFGPQHRFHLLRHTPTGAHSSHRTQGDDPLTDSDRECMLYLLAIDVLGKTMTEDKWQRCPDAKPMLKFLEGRAKRRKLRLFACAMCRLSVHLLVGLDGERLLREAEEAADQGGNEVGIPLSNEELKEYAARHSINARGPEAQRGEVEASHLLQRCRGDVAPVNQSEWLAAWHNAMFAQYPFLCTDPDSEAGGPADQVAALLDIFGNPFRHSAFSPGWQTDAVVGLARSMYDSRDFGVMPILADALEDAGCDSADMLAHCRSPGRHVRGCWLVDLVLANE